jgi:MFS family permease
METPRDVPPKAEEKAQHVENLSSSTEHNSESDQDTQMTFRRFMAIIVRFLAFSKWRTIPSSHAAVQLLGICIFSCIWSLFAVSNLLTVINKDLGMDALDDCLCSSCSYNPPRSVDSYSWMATAQVLAGGVPSVALGRLSDIYGRRMFILIGAVLVIIGSALCANATFVPIFIGGSAILGVTYSFYNLTWAAIGELVQKKHRPIVFGMMEASAGLAGTFGPVIGT